MPTAVRGLHPVTERDFVNRTGVCRTCGPVPISAQGRCLEEQRHYRSKHRERFRNYKTERRYGLLREQRDRLFEAQGRSCAICGKGESDLPAHGWHLDHDHAFPGKDPSGHRGILCRLCNIGLGCFFDSPENLQAAGDYLRRWHAWLGVIT